MALLFLRESSEYGWCGLEIEVASHTNPISAWLWSELWICPSSFSLWRPFTGCGHQEEFKVRVYRVRTSHPSIQAHPFRHLSTGSRLILRAETRRETRVTMRRPSMRSRSYYSISWQESYYSWESQPSSSCGIPSCLSFFLLDKHYSASATFREV